MLMHQLSLTDPPPLNLAAWAPRSLANGPGARCVLWVQGCPRRCPGCINPDFLPTLPRQSMPVATLAARILALPGIEGVSYSGGEPFAQAAALAALSEPLRAAGLGILCYSGYTLEELQRQADPAVAALLARLDLLIDGPFIAERAAPLRWRGSDNQRLHCLTPRYLHAVQADAPAAAEVELCLDAGGLAATGFWPPELLQRLQQHLER